MLILNSCLSLVHCFLPIAKSYREILTRQFGEQIYLHIWYSISLRNIFLHYEMKIFHSISFWEKKSEVWRSVFLLIRAILSKIYSYRLLFRRFCPLGLVDQSLYDKIFQLPSKKYCRNIEKTKSFLLESFVRL